MLRIVSVALFALGIAAGATAQQSPAAFLGFRPGADGQLASWDQVCRYFATVDQSSDRVAVQTLGRSTLDRPFLAAVVSSPDTIANLGRFQEFQHRLADPRFSPPGSSGDPILDSKTVVLVTCSIHSDETASTLMALELLHELATANDERTLEILANTILLLVPSVNPDGVDLVAEWYERTKGKPWEGSGMPRLYHPYAGHDTNRDWFMMNLAETRLLTRFLYKEWYPTITWDLHQMGPRGPRLFVPPFFDPINPNLDPRMNQAIRLVGAHLAADLAVEGKKGVATGVMYDNWWNGGNRTVPQRHNMVGILTEAASVRLATPVFLDKSELRGGGRGFADHSPNVDFPDPWPGGWWRLRDIVDYELTCARSLLTLAARYRTWFQSNYRAMSQSAIDTGNSQPPFAWIVPAGQSDPGTAAELVRILADTGVEVRRATGQFSAAGATFPAGSWILPAAQPYRAHLKDMVERQVYPTRLGPDGAPEQPYDVAGWSLPLQMAVQTIEVAEPLNGVESELIEAITLPAEPISGVSDPKSYTLSLDRLADYAFLNRCFEAGVPIRRLVESARLGEVQIDAGTLALPASDAVRDLYRETIAEPRFRPRLVGTDVEPRKLEHTQPLPRPRIAVYQPWVPNMDEGWTRLVLDEFGFVYSTAHNGEIRAGNLIDRFDVLVIASVSPDILSNGFSSEATEPAYTGGLGAEGAAAIRAFVEAGGSLVCLEDSSAYAIEILDLPIKDVLQGVPPSSFYCPGSILRAEYVGDDLITRGQSAHGSVYFANSMAFEVEQAKKSAPGDRMEVLARYAAAGLLESGWLSGESKIAGKAALVAAKKGEGKVVLFAFPPQHRGQPRGTFRLLFNALLPNLRHD